MSHTHVPTAVPMVPAAVPTLSASSLSRWSLDLTLTIQEWRPNAATTIIWHRGSTVE